MKVRDMIKHLQEYNLDADFKIVSDYDGCSILFDFGCGYSDNVSKEECEEVCLILGRDTER